MAARLPGRSSILALPTGRPAPAPALARFTLGPSRRGAVSKPSTRLPVPAAPENLKPKKQRSGSDRIGSDRMAAFYGSVFGWQAELLGPEMGNYTVVITTESDGSRPTTPGTINGGFFLTTSDYTSHAPSVVIAADDVRASLTAVEQAGWHRGGTASGDTRRRAVRKLYRHRRQPHERPGAAYPRLDAARLIRATPRPRPGDAPSTWTPSDAADGGCGSEGSPDRIWATFDRPPRGHRADWIRPARASGKRPAQARCRGAVDVCRTRDAAALRS
jgi:hypothetical protein